MGSDSILMLKAALEKRCSRPQAAPDHHSSAFFEETFKILMRMCVEDIEGKSSASQTRQNACGRQRACFRACLFTHVHVFPIVIWLKSKEEVCKQKRQRKTASALIDRLMCTVQFS